MKAIRESDVACVSGGEMSNTSLAIIIVGIAINPVVVGTGLLLGYYSNSDLKDCGP